MTLSKRDSTKFLIGLSLRLAKPGSGTSREFLSRRTAMKIWPDLTSALGEIPWAVVGGVATRAYMPERTTADLDVFIEASQAGEVHRRLAGAGFEFKQELSIGGSAWNSPEGIEVDLLEAREEWQAEAIQNAAYNRDAQGLPILPFESFILLKFRSGRVQDLADISRMLGLADEENIRKARTFFSTMEPSSLEDFDNLLELGRLEIK